MTASHVDSLPCAGEADCAAACPNLGLANDLLTHALFPTSQHRCYAERPRKVSIEHQVRYCLGSEFQACRHNKMPRPLWRQAVSAIFSK